jgi:teichoic acid transport system permease protein
MLKRFFQDTRKYHHYSKYAAKAALEAEVAGSYLNRLGWIFNPFCMMIIYTIIFGYVFHAKEQYFPLFIFIGLTFWDFFNRTLNSSVKIVKKNKGIINKVYLPKFILVIKEMRINFRKMLFSGIIIVGLMVFYRVPLSWNIFWIVPVFLIEVLFTFGICCIVLHFGVFVEDLSNIVRIIMRFCYYGVGVFFNIQKRIKNPIFRELDLHCNPMALILHSARQSLIYQTTPSIHWMALWAVLSIILCLIGVRLIYAYENSYAKVI